MNLTIGQFNESFPPIVDGVANVVLNYARCLNNDQNTCCVVTPKHPDAVDDYGFDVHRFGSIKVPTRNEYRVGMPQMSTSFWMGLKKIPFDIVHAHCPFSSGLAARSIARKRDIPFVAILKPQSNRIRSLTTYCSRSRVFMNLRMRSGSSMKRL